jgi:O-succinylbenzoate synthase
VKLAAVELRRIELELVTPFRTSFGTETTRDVLLVKAIADDGTEGWAECVAMTEPTYTPEYVDGAHRVIRTQLLPRLFAGHDFAAVKGHRMAKAAVNTATLDATLRQRNTSLASYLGATRSEVDAGVSVGIPTTSSIDELLATVARHVGEGYRRIKLKIEPGWDVEPVRAVRAMYAGPLQVDANTAYTRDDAGHLAELDEFGLLLIEQPLAEDDLEGHAALAKRIRTPICLDESIESAAQADHAIAIGACAIVSIKPGRVGGYEEAKRIHDLCATLGVPVWCGGMLETGIGRAANVALAALPNFTLPGDISASNRYFEHDIVTEPFVLHDGRLRVPTGAGIGVTPDLDAIERATTTVETVKA